VRSHPSANAFIDHLFELLDDNTVDWDAARAIGLLASEDTVLTKRNNAVLKVCKENLAETKKAAYL
jgi:DNA repair/transcription protein MET18/MMS19